MPRAPLIENRTGHSAVALPNGIFVTGGFGNEYLDSVELYDEQEDEWTQLPPMLNPRARHTSIVSSDLAYVYVIGGINDNQV